MKVNRSSTPEMVKHKSFASEFERLERSEARQRSNAMIFFCIIVIIVVALVRGF